MDPPGKRAALDRARFIGGALVVLEKDAGVCAWGVDETELIFCLAAIFLDEGFFRKLEMLCQIL